MAFSSISGVREHEGDRLVKIFSRQPLNDSILSEIFEKGFELFDAHSWQAYPRFHPPEKFSSFVLSDKLYYVNGIETGASAVEISAVGARNVALLVGQDLRLQRVASRRRYSPVKEKFKEEATEL